MYAELIRAALALMNRGGYNVAAVEAWMRLGHATLDHLEGQAFLQEVALACACIDDATPADTASLVASFGLPLAVVEG